MDGCRDYELFGCDALNVPLRAGAFDAAISIAVLHHISTPERRVALIRWVSFFVGRWSNVPMLSTNIVVS